MEAINLFGGAGGWESGNLDLVSPLGIETENDVVLTRAAAGLRTFQQDVTVLDPASFGPVDGIIGSPPCRAWSSGGRQLGLVDRPLVYECAEAMKEGRDERVSFRSQCSDDSSLFVVEPLRWVMALKPRWVALEQVPPVVEFWKWLAAVLAGRGYSSWAGLLSAECYGVPQTRKRAFLIASLDHPVSAPPPTHQAYGSKGAPGVLKPWVSMEEAIQRGGDRPSHTVTSTNQTWFRNNSTSGATRRSLQEPAPTLVFGKASTEVGWVPDPDKKVHRGGKAVTVEEAAILQGFPPDWPFQGYAHSQFQQIGDAVPPPLARAVLRQAIGP